MNGDAGNWENFHTDTCSDVEYSAFVAWLSETTAEELRAAQGDAAAQKRALLRYYRRGDDADMTSGELIDFLGVSFPSILDLAGFTEEEGDAVMAISDALTYEEVRNTEL